MAIILPKVEATSTPFVWGGNILVGDTVADYATATLGEVLKSMKFVGQISADSFTQEGEDPSTDNWLAADGTTITATTVPGTNAFAIELASFSAVSIQKYLDAKSLAVTIDAADASDVFNTATKVYSITGGHTQIVPVVQLNKEKTMGLMYAKAQMDASMTFAENRYTLRLLFTALEVSADELQTIMFLYDINKTV